MGRVRLPVDGGRKQDAAMRAVTVYRLRVNNDNDLFKT
jgi:hypothetical protein